MLVIWAFVVLVFHQCETHRWVCGSLADETQWCVAQCYWITWINWRVSPAKCPCSFGPYPTPAGDNQALRDVAQPKLLVQQKTVKGGGGGSAATKDGIHIASSSSCSFFFLLLFLFCILSFLSFGFWFLGCFFFLLFDQANDHLPKRLQSPCTLPFYADILDVALSFALLCLNLSIRLIKRWTIPKY